MLSENLTAKLNQALQDLQGNHCQIISISSCHGGDIHQAYQLHTTEGNFFLKVATQAQFPLLKTEANSLKKLAATQSLLVPQVLAISSQHSEQAWLLLEFLSLSHQGDDAQRGRDLALMHHQIHHAAQPFGWEEDNFIGHTAQINTWRSDWVSFYAENRLQPQLQLALKNGASSALFDLGQQIMAQLPRFFEHYQPKASPLHGDLWGGNSAFLTSGEAVIFDPASYYGDRETDLAMTELFGGFSDEFYRGYQSVFPLDSGYAQRKPLYNLYHILNHYNLFGGGYLSQAQRLMKQLIQA